MILNRFDTLILKVILILEPINFFSKKQSNLF
jgi:hypothetical protein